jgi:hypothetical protein
MKLTFPKGFEPASGDIKGFSVPGNPDVLPGAEKQTQAQIASKPQQTPEQRAWDKAVTTTQERSAAHREASIAKAGEYAKTGGPPLPDGPNLPPTPPAGERQPSPRIAAFRAARANRIGGQS